MVRNKTLKRIFSVLIIIVLFALIGLTNGQTRKVTLFETIVSDLITVPERLVIGIKDWLSIDASKTANIDDLRKENQVLKEQNEELKKKLADYEVLASENKMLKEKSQIVDSYPDYNVVVASIIFDSTNNWEETYIVDKGSKDGVLPDMTVMTQDGLVGYVESVTESTSKIVSILDAGNTVSARSTRTRDAVLCKGNISLKDTGKMKITSIPIGVEFIEGDKIETSGMGGIYPKGISIGEIETFSAKKNPSDNEAIVKAYVDFNKLETVAIIVSEK